MTRAAALAPMVALLVALLPASARAGDFMVFGLARTPCATFLRDTPARQREDLVWALGFATAYNLYATPGKQYLDPDNDTTLRRLKAACRDKPAEPLFSVEAAMLDAEARPTP